jgi:hypothetical protein
MIDENSVNLLPACRNGPASMHSPSERLRVEFQPSAMMRKTGLHPFSLPCSSIPGRQARVNSLPRHPVATWRHMACWLVRTRPVVGSKSGIQPSTRHIRLWRPPMGRRSQEGQRPAVIPLLSGLCPQNAPCPRDYRSGGAGSGLGRWPIPADGLAATLIPAGRTCGRQSPGILP